MKDKKICGIKSENWIFISHVFFKGTYIAVMKLRKMDLFDIILKCRPNYNSFLDIKLLTAEVSKLLFNQINWWFERNERKKEIWKKFRKKNCSDAKQSS